MSNASGLASATWDLDSLFAGGAHSAVFATFLDTLHDQLEGLRALSRGDTTAGPAPVLAPDLDDAWPSRLDAWQSCAAALEEAAARPLGVLQRALPERLRDAALVLGAE